MKKDVNQNGFLGLLLVVLLVLVVVLLNIYSKANVEGTVGDWETLIVTMVFASILIFAAVIIAERFGGTFAPIWIVGFLIGMSILFDYGGVRQTEFQFLNIPMLFACGPMLWAVLALGQDYINEFYGPKLAMNYTYGMFMAKVGVALGTMWIIFVLPVPVTDPNLAKTAVTFNTLMLQAPRINIASIVAVVAALLANARVYAWIRAATKGKHLWLRNIVSSMLALTIDGFVFFYGAFAFALPWDVVWNITISYILISYVTIFIDMGFLYIMVHIKRHNLFGISDRIGQSLDLKTLKALENE